MVGDHLQAFLDEVFNIVNAMGVNSGVKAELALYQLKDVPQVWFTQMKDCILGESDPLEWKE